jgi:hypothetical protein
MKPLAWANTGWVEMTLDKKSKQLAVSTMMKQVQNRRPIREGKNKSKPTVLVRAKKK